MESRFEQEIAAAPLPPPGALTGRALAAWDAPPRPMSRRAGTGRLAWVAVPALGVAGAALLRPAAPPAAVPPPASSAPTPSRTIARKSPAPAAAFRPAAALAVETAPAPPARPIGRLQVAFAPPGAPGPARQMAIPPALPLPVAPPVFGETASDSYRDLAQAPWRVSFGYQALPPRASALHFLPVQTPDATPTAEPPRADRRTLRFVVAQVTPEADGGALLEPSRPNPAWEDVLKDPTLRDQVRVKLTAAVVAQRKPQGIADLQDRAIQATGTMEQTIYLCFPAIAVQTVTVERAEDLSIADPPPTDALRERLEKLRAARARDDTQAIYELCTGPEFDRLVIEAAAAGDEAGVIELIQQAWYGGPERAAKGGNGVTWAAYYPTAEPVKRLLARGIAPGVGDENGDTGLHRTYRAEIARLLIERGAPVDARNQAGETPLIARARQANPWTGGGILALLLQAGANPNAADHAGRTALMYAAKSGMAEEVALLLARGADPKRKDKQGKRAKDSIHAWAWQRVPGYATEETLALARRRAERDRYRIEAMLAGRPDPGSLPDPVLDFYRSRETLLLGDGPLIP